MEPQNIDIDDIKEFCLGKIDSLKKDRRQNVLEFLVMNVGKSSIQQHPDGCRVNLDNIPDNILRTLYGLIRYKLEN